MKCRVVGCVEWFIHWTPPEKCYVNEILHVSDYDFMSNNPFLNQAKYFLFLNLTHLRAFDNMLYFVLYFLQWKKNQVICWLSLFICHCMHIHLKNSMVYIWATSCVYCTYFFDWWTKNTFITLLCGNIHWLDYGL